LSKIILDYPVTVEKVEYKALAMRRPKVKDQLAVDKGAGTKAEKEICLFANLCEVAPEVIEELDMLDHGALQKVYTGFLSRTPEKSDALSCSSTATPDGAITS